MYAAAMIHHENDSQLVHFYHAALGSPAISTFTEAASRGYLDCFPGLTVQKIRRNKPHTIATSLGHLDQTRKNYKSTKQSVRPPSVRTTPSPTMSPLQQDTFPPIDSSPTHVIYTRIERTHRNFMDSSGRFPVKSRSGNEYVLAMYNYDGNYIHIETMKRGKGRLLDAYKRGHSFFKAHGCQVKFERLDNETSKELEDFMRLEEISFQYVPPNCKRRNAAERALRTFKNHFISTLCTVDKDFPLQLWDTILPQAELSLNMLRGSRLDPRISAWEQLHGKYDFNAHPIVPLGMRIVLHEKPPQRGTWSPHGVEGFYLGPALEHYRCYRGWVIKTQRERVVDTVAWHPQNVMMPGASEKEILTKVLTDLRAAIETHSAQLSAPAAELIADLQQDFSTLFPVTPPPVTLSPVQRLIPLVVAITYQLQTPPQPANGEVIPTTEDQRVGTPPTPHSEQRVGSPCLGASGDAPCRTIVPFSPRPPPGRPALRPGGDNITYNRTAPFNNALPTSLVDTPPSAPTVPPVEKPILSPSTHVGNWQVKRVVHHRGKVTHRSKLQFRVQWEPLDGKVSSDTWMPWNQARWLHATRTYVQTVPRLHYILPLMPTETNNAARTVGPPLLQTNAHFANSTTGIDGQPLRYNRLMKGSDASAWIEASAQEFDRLLSTTKTMHFIRPEDKPPNRLASYYNPQCSIKHGTDKKVRGTYGGDRTHRLCWCRFRQHCIS